MITKQPGKLSAWAGFGLGTSVSVAANITHATQGTWSWPELIGAAFWPIALMISVEVLARRDSSRDRRIKKFGLGVGLVVVAGVAAFLSYLHMAGLLMTWGEGGWSAHLGPLAVDGLMLVCGLALLPDRRSNRVVLVYANPIGPEPAPVAPVQPVSVESPTEFPDGTLVLPSGLTYRPPREDTPVGDAALASILEHLDEPQPTTTAPLNGHTRTVKAATKPSKPRRTAAKPADGKSQVRAWFDAEHAAGRTPTGPEIAEKAGRDRRTGARWLAEFTAEQS